MTAVRQPTTERIDDCIGAVETAHLLGVVVQTLWRWDKDGIGPKRHYFGRKPYYIRAEVERFQRDQAAGAS